MIQTNQKREQLLRSEYKRQSSSKFPTIPKIIPISNIVKTDTKPITINK